MRDLAPDWSAAVRFFSNTMNDPKHTSKLCSNDLKQKKEQQALLNMVWPPQSPNTGVQSFNQQIQNYKKWNVVAAYLIFCVYAFVFFLPSSILMIRVFYCTEVLVLKRSWKINISQSLFCKIFTNFKKTFHRAFILSKYLNKLHVEVVCIRHSSTIANHWQRNLKIWKQHFEQFYSPICKENA